MLKFRRERSCIILSLFFTLTFFTVSCANFVNSQHLHTVTIQSGIVGGEIKVGKSVFSVGEKVNLVIEPHADYILRQGSLYYTIGKARVLIPGSSFIMPSSDITVYGSFDNSYDISVNFELSTINFVNELTLKCQYNTGGNPEPPELLWSIEDETVVVFNGEPEMVFEDGDIREYEVTVSTPGQPLFNTKTAITVVTENGQSSAKCEVAAIPDCFVIGPGLDVSECSIMNVIPERSEDLILKTEGTLRIPDYIDGFKVTQIGPNAFATFSTEPDGTTTEVTKLIIPSGIRSIGSDAFTAFKTNAIEIGGGNFEFTPFNVEILSTTPPEIQSGSTLFNQVYKERVGLDTQNAMDVLKITVSGNSEVFRRSWTDWKDHIIGINEYRIFVEVDGVGGHAYAHKTSAVYGDTVDIVCEPLPGYQIQSNSIALYEDNYGSQLIDRTAPPYNRFRMPKRDVYVKVRFAPIPTNYDLQFKFMHLDTVPDDEEIFKTYVEGNLYDGDGKPVIRPEYTIDDLNNGTWNKDVLVLPCKAKIKYQISGIFYTERGNLAQYGDPGNDINQYKTSQYWKEALKADGNNYQMELIHTSYYVIRIFVDAVTLTVNLRNTKYGTHTSLRDNEEPAVEVSRNDTLATLFIPSNSVTGAEIAVRYSDDDPVPDIVWENMATPITPEINADKRHERLFAGFVTAENVLVPIRGDSNSVPSIQNNKDKLFLEFVPASIGDTHKLKITNVNNLQNYFTSVQTIDLYAKYYEPANYDSPGQSYPEDNNRFSPENHYIELDMNGGWFQRRTPITVGTNTDSYEEHFNLPHSDVITNSGNGNVAELQANDPDPLRYEYTYKLRSAIYDDPIPQTVSMYYRTFDGTGKKTEQLKIADVPFTSAAKADERYEPVRPGYRLLGFFNFPQSDGTNPNREMFQNSKYKTLAAGAPNVSDDEKHLVFYSHEPQESNIALAYAQNQHTNPAKYLNENFETYGDGITGYNGEKTLYAWWEEIVMKSSDTNNVSKIKGKVVDYTKFGTNISTRYEIWSFRDIASIAINGLKGADDAKTEFRLMRNIKMHPTSLSQAINSIAVPDNGEYTRIADSYEHKPGVLNGMLDGQGYSISNIYIHETFSTNVGLFSMINGGVCNLILESGHVIGGSPDSNEGVSVGALCGKLEQMHSSLAISGVYNHGVKVSGHGVRIASAPDNGEYTGGLVGHVTINTTAGFSNPEIKRCGNIAEVYHHELKYENYVGGLFGKLTIRGSNTGQTCYVDYLFNEGPIKLLSATPDLASDTYQNQGGMGGICGLITITAARETYFNGIYNTGSLTGAEISSSIDDANAKLLDCAVAKGGIAGIVKADADIPIRLNCVYNTADVEGDKVNGFFFLDYESDATIEPASNRLRLSNVYNSGKVKINGWGILASGLISSNSSNKYSVLINPDNTLAYNRASGGTSPNSTYALPNAVDGLDPENGIHTGTINIEGRPKTMSLSGKRCFNDETAEVRFTEITVPSGTFSFEPHPVKNGTGEFLQIRGMHEFGCD